MTSPPCMPCELDELQAWKCMMDSMVKFIQASTKLMNTFNERSNPQMALQKENFPIDTKSPCKLLANSQIASPEEAFLNDCKAPCNLPTVTKPQERICDKNCNVNKSKKTSKCKCVGPVNGIRNKREKEEHLCHAECKICLPSRIPKCKKCLSTSSNKSLISSSGSKKGSKSGEPAVEKSQTEEKIEIEEKIETEENIETEEKIEAEDKSETEENIQIEEKSPVEENGVDDVENHPAGDAEPEVVNEETNVTEEDPVLSPSKVDEIIQKEEDEKKPSLVDCTCQYSETVIKPDSLCNCYELWKEENAKAKEKPLCSCPLSSSEKLDITNKMQEKLEIAQNEIDKLKKEIQQLQFTEMTKHSNSAALYKEIMKESVLDKSLNISSTQGLKTSKRVCSNLKNKFSAPQQQRDRTMMNLERSVQQQRSKPLATSSLLGKELLNGTQSEPASGQIPGSSAWSPGSRCDDKNNICIRRSKQQRRPNTYGKSAFYQSSFSPEYGQNQQPVNQSFQPRYCCYGRFNQEQYCDCPPRPEPPMLQVDVEHHLYQTGPQYDTQNNYFNDNYISDDDSCDDTSCANEDCPKNKGKLQY